MITRGFAAIAFGVAILSLGVPLAVGDESSFSVCSTYVLRPGPQLFIDDFLIEKSAGVERRVVQPTRTLSNPVVTGAAGHLNWQPWFTVLHDATRANDSRFRIWYNADVVADTADNKFQTRLGYLESADGVTWPAAPRMLKDAPYIRFGACVLDDGPQFQPVAERYKLMYYADPEGPVVGFSPDGLQWTMHRSARRILTTTPAADSWHAAFDPLRRRYFLFGKSNEAHRWTNAEGRAVSETVRRFGTAVSDDFKTWKDFKLQFPPDHLDSGITEGYAVTGFQTRGDLLLGFYQVLRDDLTTDGAPKEAVAANRTEKAAGMGHTVLCWTRDGETWQRDRERDAFLTPDPAVGVWDHAMAWVGSVTPVGDELFIYYAGYRWGHKFRRSEDRQIGLVRMKRDRYVAREAGEQRGTMTTRPITLEVDSLTLNADAETGEIRVQICDRDGRPLPGFTFSDCRRIAEDSLTAPVSWKRPLQELRGQTVRLEFALRNARLFAVDAR